MFVYYYILINKGICEKKGKIYLIKVYYLKIL